MLLVQKQFSREEMEWVQSLEWNLWNCEGLKGLLHFYDAAESFKGGPCHHPTP